MKRRRIYAFDRVADREADGDQPRECSNGADGCQMDPPVSSRAYAEDYLFGAQRVPGDAVDFAVMTPKLEPDNLLHFLTNRPA